MPVTSTDIVNQALQLVGDNLPAVTGAAPTFDSSAAGQAAQALYAPCVATVQRQWGWDASRNFVALTVSGNTAPFIWAFEYLYPTNGIQVWQLVPATIADPFNPAPVNWTVGNTLVAGAQTKIIWTNLASARAIYNNNPREDVWDPGFREAVVRMLASEFATALLGKPDSAEGFLKTAATFGAAAQRRDD